MKSIFVVDDNDTNLLQAKFALEEHYRVRLMASAITMLKLIEKITPDLILLDIMMPEMNGFEAIEKLKTNDRTKNIPVLFLTASTDKDTEENCKKHGAADFVTKPFSPKVLLERIARHMP